MYTIITALKRDGNEANEAIANAIMNEQGFNSHGVGIVARQYKDKQVTNIRKMRVEREEIMALLNAYDMVSVHLRFATVGKKCVENCHYWKLGDWYFAHNGGVGMYAKSNEQEQTDSYLMFQQIHDEGMLKKNGKIARGDINDFVQDNGFWGRFVLLNSEKHKMHFYGDFETYFIQEKSLVISTTTLEFKKESKHTFFGIEWGNDAHEVDVIEGDFDGHMTLNLKSRTSSFAKTPDTKKYSYTPSQATFPTPSDWTDKDSEDEARYWESINRDSDEKHKKHNPLDEPSDDDMPCTHDKTISVFGATYKKCINCNEAIQPSIEETIIANSVKKLDKLDKQKEIPFEHHPIGDAFRRAMKREGVVIDPKTDAKVREMLKEKNVPIV